MKLLVIQINILKQVIKITLLLFTGFILLYKNKAPFKGLCRMLNGFNVLKHGLTGTGFPTRHACCNLT